MVLYFSGTGNSQLAAVWLAQRIADSDVVSINRFLKAGESPVLTSDRPLVFVAPTYCWRLPKVVERWIMGARFEGSQEAHFVLTCGGDCGNAAAYADNAAAAGNAPSGARCTTSSWWRENPYGRGTAWRASAAAPPALLCDG